MHWLKRELAHSDGISEEVAFIQAGDRRLVGVLARPAVVTGLPVLLLHGWGGGRCGPHDLLTMLAREAARAGSCSLRFDFSDRGESSSVAAGASLDQMGEDALAAADYLLQHASAQKMLILGMCSGGNVGIGILDRLPACAGLFLMSVYPFSEGDSFGRRSHRTAAVAQGYLRKVFRASTWRRLIGGAIDLRGVWQAMFGHHRAEQAKVTQAERAGGSPMDNLLRPNLPVAMIYGSADPDTAASMACYQAFTEKHGLPISFTVFDNADHNFYSVQQSRRLADAASDFYRQVAGG